MTSMVHDDNVTLALEENQIRTGGNAPKAIQSGKIQPVFVFISSSNMAALY
jgi:hypothetical protein